MSRLLTCAKTKYGVGKYMSVRRASLLEEEYFGERDEEEDNVIIMKNF